MENQEELIDPNLNADAYRNLSAADQPPVHDKQLEVLITHKDGSMVLAASNMIDRYWNGTIWFYTDLTVLDCTKYAAALRTQSGVRVAAYLEKYDKFITGEDSGLMQVFELDSKTEMDTKELRCMGYMCQHDDSLTSISTFSNNTNVVSSGMDACIKLWDTEEMMATNSYNQAQTDIITCVQVQNESTSVFVSTSLDSEALLWDIRKTKPALGLWKKSGFGLTSAAWKPADDNTLAIGGNDGSITILDIRNTSSPYHESIQFSRGVHKLIFNPDCSVQLAACCDSSEFKVLDISKNCENIFENNSHNDFVRGLAWYKNELISCSWDNTVLRHSINLKINA